MEVGMKGKEEEQEKGYRVKRGVGLKEKGLVK